MNEGYSTTADYQCLDVALKSFWASFNELKNEMDSFVPRTLSDFDEERKIWFEESRKLNPNHSDDEIVARVERRIKSAADAQWQFFGKFSDRFMTMYVTVTLLSQALCEAEINAILAIGLHEKGEANKFSKIEKGDIRKKWLEFPKDIASTYELKKDSGLYVTLNHLIEERNAWMHHKIELSVGEEKVLSGSSRKNESYQEMTVWMQRYFSLPYDLAAHILPYTQSMVASMLIFTRNPIPISDAHKE